MRKDIRVSLQAKSRFDKLNSKEQFSTSSECIIQICNFFEENNLSPKDKIGVKMTNSFNELERTLKVEIMLLKEFIKNDSQSLRKRHGAIEKEYFIPINRKITEITNSLHPNTSSQKENIELQEKLDSILRDHEKLKKQLEERSNALRRIINNLSMENLNGKEYPIINLTEHELENIERLII